MCGSSSIINCGCKIAIIAPISICIIGTDNFGINLLIILENNIDNNNTKI